MRRTALLPLLALAMTLSAAPAFAGPGFDIGARGIYWFPAATGSLDTGNGRIDAKSDLGLDKESLPGAEAFVRVLWLGARAGYMPVKFESEKSVGTLPSFGGVNFSNSKVVTKVDLKTADLELSFAPKITVPWLANLYAGVLVKGKLVDGTVALDNGTRKETRDLKGVIPMVGVTAGAGVLKDMIRVDGRVAGIAWSGNHLYEGDVYLSFSPFDPPVVDLKLQGGYKVIDLKLEDGDLRAEMRIKGPYAGVQLDF